MQSGKTMPPPVERRGRPRAWSHRLLILAASCLALALVLFASPAQAHAATGRPSLQVSAGFDTRYRDGNWIPVQVTLINDGPDFAGILSLSAPIPSYLAQGNALPSSNYQVPVSLPNGTQKQVTLYIPLDYDGQSVIGKLLDGNGNVVVSQTASLKALMPGDVFVGILSDRTSGFGPLNATPLPDQSGAVVLDFLSARLMPAAPDLLNNFDAIVLDDFTLGTLSAAQLSSLHTWVLRGGTLIAVGGPEWRRTLSALPAELLPTKPNGAKSIPAGTSLLPPGWPTGGTGSPGQNSVRLPTPVSTAVLQQENGDENNELVLAPGSIPLIVQSQRGQGTILYLAFDPTLEPILSWQGASALWEGLLLRGLGDRLLTHSLNSASTSGSERPLLASRVSTLLQSLLPNTIPSPGWTLALLLIGNILLIGPLRFIFVRLLKRRDWSWRIVLSSIVVFSLLSYGLAFKQKGSSIVSNSISVAMLGQNGLPAKITTYLGVFVPNEGNFQVHIPGSGLVQPSPDALYSSSSGANSATQASPASVVSARDGTDVSLQDVNIWTMHAISSQQDRQVQQGLTAHLTIQNDTLVGTVTNTLGYTLSDAFLLLPNSVLKLGQLAAGATRHVQLKLNSQPFAANSTLADLIALDTNSPLFTAMPTQPSTSWQRHLAMLYALDGEGIYSSASLLSSGQCNLPVPILPDLLCNYTTTGNGNEGGITNGISTNAATTPGWNYTSTRDTDPLLVPGSLVTLLGWAENVPDLAGSATINSSQVGGFHETFVQAPLSVNLAGSLNLPPDFIEGRLVDVAGNNARVQLPGVYTISTGSMTFEYDVPVDSLRLNGLTITVPDVSLYAQVGAFVSVDSLPFRLYNWHTHSWDSISLNEGTFTSDDVRAHIGPSGRILLQLANSERSLGTFAFGKPSLNLQGAASNKSSANG
jgi:hypothetical protein